MKQGVGRGAGCGFRVRGSRGGATVLAGHVQQRRLEAQAHAGRVWPSLGTRDAAP